MERLVPVVVRIQTALRVAGVDSAVIGAIALAAWGEPRFTSDVDLKVLLDRSQADRLMAALPAGCTPIGGPPREMIEQSGIVFVKDASGVRVDLLLADVEFDRQAILRARSIELRPGLFARVCTPEDLYIYKAISTREKDESDLRSIVRRQGETLDRTYIIHWLRQFELAFDDSTLVARFERLILTVGR